MRQNVICAVRALSDEAHQTCVWIWQVYPVGACFDDFALNLNILYDDTLVLEDPVASLGTVLASRQEAAAPAELWNMSRRRCGVRWWSRPLWCTGP
ncbi:hypothetical protein ACFV23_24505 [Streptomyces sp. NPDC059627]